MGKLMNHVEPLFQDLKGDESGITDFIYLMKLLRIENINV